MEDCGTPRGPVRILAKFIKFGQKIFFSPGQLFSCYSDNFVRNCEKSRKIEKFSSFVRTLEFFLHDALVKLLCMNLLMVVVVFPTPRD